MKLTWRASLGAVTLCVAFCVDRAIKWWAMNRLSDTGLFAIKDTLGFLLERNQGISYSIPLPQTMLVVVLGILLLLLVTMAVIAIRRHDWALVAPLALIIVGASSNALDRIKFGYVIDYVTLTGWPVFNIADVIILGGSAWLIVIVLRRPPAIRAV
ncbi:MAG: signal peptidase II [Patescibacteria group bacterium]|jgi:signal peptidase II